MLNPIGVNCIRAFTGRGIRVWGARTLSSDPSWRYINVRRLFNYRRVVDRARHPVGRVRAQRPSPLGRACSATIGAFLHRCLARRRASVGRPTQAFFVKCDAETNPPDVRDAGQLVIDIGIAPVKPAEFVIFRIGQYSPDA